MLTDQPSDAAVAAGAAVFDIRFEVDALGGACGFAALDVRVVGGATDRATDLSVLATCRHTFALQALLFDLGAASGCTGLTATAAVERVKVGVGASVVADDLSCWATTYTIGAALPDLAAVVAGAAVVDVAGWGDTENATQHLPAGGAVTFAVDTDLGARAFVVADAAVVFVDTNIHALVADGAPYLVAGAAMTGAANLPSVARLAAGTTVKRIVLDVGARIRAA